VPSAETIRAGDADRLAADVALLAADAAEEDLAAARRLLESRGADEVAVALVRRDRARRPAAEELPETARAAREAPARAGERRAPRRAPTDGVWFRLALGRSRQADPRWVLPLLCRRGSVTRDEIGKIVILPQETRFEIAAGAAERFLRAARRPDPRMPDARIEPLVERGRAEGAPHARRPGAAEGAKHHERTRGGEAPSRRSPPTGRGKGKR
jgi:ATP-dependent RNA helicase DeaD